ncbi:MAG TPA: SDR family NAD(P)-dependent oxidoreductase [Microvirga sp.]|jgi:3-oxoacyl-[acyl-carrier protein] reductase|nr:SDR family NAD(P)-dependent oxidoreductase [Microvirga sp.]
MTDEFAGQVVVVTGAAQGIGRAIVRDFAGARVWALDIDAVALEGLRDQDGVTPHALDVSDEAAVEACIAAILSAHGRIDVLVHCAGGVRGQVGRPIETVPESDWHAIFAVNATGAFLLAKHVAPAMKRQGHGRIVTISSGAGLRPSLTGIQAYAAAKHALVGLTKQLAHELGPHGVTVNSVAPGFVRSNPATERQWESYGPEGQRRLVEGVFTRRLGTPEDIAWAVRFFAAERSGWITGQILSVDGGRA